MGHCDEKTALGLIRLLIRDLQVRQCPGTVGGGDGDGGWD